MPVDDLRDQIEHVGRAEYEFKVALASDERDLLRQAATRNNTSMAEVVRAALRVARVLPPRGGRSRVMHTGSAPTSGAALAETLRRVGGLEPLTGSVTIDPTDDPTDDIDRSGGELEG